MLPGACVICTRNIGYKPKGETLQTNRFASSCLFALLFMCGNAFAEPASIALDRYSSGETPQDDFELNRAKVAGDHYWGSQLVLNYANNPLTWRANDGREANIVGGQTTGLVAINYSLWNRATFYIGMPIVMSVTGIVAEGAAQLGAPPKDTKGPGDLYFGARFLAVGNDNDFGAFAVQAALAFPTAGFVGDQSFRGEETVTFRPKLIGELRPGAGSRAVLNLGAVIRNDYEGAPFDVTDELTFALGYAIPVLPALGGSSSSLDAVAYLRGNTTFTNAFASAYTPVEVMLGARYVGDCMTLGLAGGAGLSRGIGAPDFRLALTVGFVAPTLETVSSNANGGVTP